MSHLGCASFLAFVLGAGRHRATVVSENHRVSFYFDDSDGRCKELTDAFFSPESAVVDNARSLLESSRELRWTIKQAEANPERIWQRD